MDLVTLKAFFQTKVGSKTAAGSIYPVDITDCLDALADAVDAGDIGGGGAVAPSIVSATCPNGAANTVVVVFNQSMTAVTTAGWSFKKNGSAWSVSSVTGATTTWTFTMGSSAINGDTLLRSYDSTTGATIGTSLELVTFTDSAVTNSVGAVAPTVVSATCPNGAANTVVVVFDQSMTGVTTAGWSFKKNGSAWSVSSVTGATTTWTFTMGSSAVFGDTLLRSYDSTTGATIGTSLEIVSFTDSSVTNSIAGGSGYETESDTFFAANTGLSTPQKDAVDALVVSLKAIGWTKFKAVYPFVGGSAAAHKWNLINPVDSDAAYRLTMNGTLTHNANGVTGDGSTGYMNTSFEMNELTDARTSSHLSLYSRTNTNPSSEFEIDVQTSAQMRWGLVPKLSGDAYGFCATSGLINSAVTTSQKLFVATRTSATVFKLFQDNTQVGSTSTGDVSTDTVNTNPCYILASNVNGVVGAGTYSNRNLAFVSIGDGLSDAEVASLTTAVNTYQTALSRNV